MHSNVTIVYKISNHIGDSGDRTMDHGRGQSHALLLFFVSSLRQDMGMEHGYLQSQSRLEAVENDHWIARLKLEIYWSEDERRLLCVPPELSNFRVLGQAGMPSSQSC